jgi:hypothetical protein
MPAVMPFQPFLNLGVNGERLHAGLHPTGGRRDPCDVICWTCGYRKTVATWDAAVTVAARHDREHNAARTTDQAV